jgi:excinuclease ABC subunit B
LQIAFNEANGITPRSVTKRIKDIIDGVYDAGSEDASVNVAEPRAEYGAMDEKALARTIRQLEKDMLDHARNLEFEKAAAARDRLFRLRQQAFGAEGHDASASPDAKG